MKILVIGSGGREHALVWKIAQSRLADKIFCAPGNGGIAQQAECVDIKADDIQGLLAFAKKEKIDLTVVGPEAPLSMGIADEFEKNGLKIFGPQEKAARLEASKVFSKEMMVKYGVPTAGYKIFDDPYQARKYLDQKGGPCVVKADGLAQGKGVIVAADAEEAKEAVIAIMQDKIFGDAGDRVIIEDCLHGQEASIIVLTDSKIVIPLASSQDHKRIFDNDTGPNTGGMGAYSPAPLVSRDLLNEILDKVIHPMIAGLNKEGITYKGVLYAGIMVTKDGPQALEFNVRMGDPETQAVLPRIKTDFLELMLAASSGDLSSFARPGGMVWDNRACACVVMASGGYPGNYEKGKEIRGLEKVERLQDVMVFHSATKKSGGKYFTNGGRILGVTGLGNTINEALYRAYQAIDEISFEGAHYRKDIGYRAVEKLSGSGKDGKSEK